MANSNDGEEAFWEDFQAHVGVGKTTHVIKLVVCLIIAAFFLGALITGRGGTPAGLGLAAAAAGYFAFTSAKLLFWDAKRYLRQ